MCTGLELALALGGTALQTANNANAQRQQAEEAARGQREQMMLRDQAASRVNQQIQDISKSNPQADETQAENEFTAALQRAKLARGGANLDSTGATSARFKDDLGLARTQASNEGKTLAQQLARIDAPQRQRFRESVAANNTGVDLSMLQDTSRAQDFLTRMRIAQRQPNALINGIGQGLTAYGLAHAGSAGGESSLPMPSDLSAGVNRDALAALRGTSPYSGGDVFAALARNGG